MKLDTLQENIGYNFKNIKLLEHALRHSSYVNEHRLSKSDCNERLEFLGDAVLELVSSEFLYKKYAARAEGELSKTRAALVCEPSLSSDAKKIDLGSYIFMGKGEEASGGRERASVVSDAFEALIGAMFLDGGLEPAKAFIERFVLVDADDKLIITDSKSALQELVQQHRKAVIEYTTIEESGPEHDKCFVVSVKINGKDAGTGSGRSKKAAEKQAALNAIKNLKGLN